jgi:hypothetical protein
MLKTALTLILLSTSAVSYAACDAGSKTIFSCTTASAKRIELCDAGAQIQYSFGKAQAKPDIVVTVPRSQASTFQWQGYGRDHDYWVNVPNGKTVYQVYASTDSLDPKHGSTRGVNVLEGDNQIATVKCSDKHPIINNLEGVDLKPAE